MSLEESSPPDVPSNGRRAAALAEAAESAPGEHGRARSTMSAQRLAAQLLDDEDTHFLTALQESGLLTELDAEELLRIASEVEEGEPEWRHVELLELYYFGGGDAEVSLRRRLADRFFLQRVGEPATAASLVSRLAELAPELPQVKLERIGGEDGPLVLRSGEHFAAVLDEYEEETDTDQFDLGEADQRKRGVPMVTVRGLVRALNVLLDRRDVRERFVALRGDEAREVYVALGVSQAVALANGGYLEDEDPADVMELGAW